MLLLHMQPVTFSSLTKLLLRMEGSEAAAHGEPLSANPYKRDAASAEHWRRGWMSPAVAAGPRARAATQSSAMPPVMP